jgi:hypothetical protein
MPTIRRLYLYAVALVSVEVVLWGAIGLVRSFFAGAVVGGSVSRLAGALSLILVGVPVFLIHWLLAQRLARRDPEERSARLRAVFLYGVLLVLLIPAAQNTLTLLDRLFLNAFGQPSFRMIFGAGQTLGDNLVAILLSLAVAAYFYTVLVSDWRLTPQGDVFPEVRRLYRYLWLLYGLLLVFFGVQQVLQFLLASLGELGAAKSAIAMTPAMLAHGLALLIVGIPIWVFVWVRIQGSLDDPAESASLLRLVVLYLLAFASLIAALVAAGLTLYGLLRFAFGEPFTLSAFMGEIADPLSLLVPSALVWVYYGRILRWEVHSLQDESRRDEPRRAELRRLYSYILAAVGLAAAFVGLYLLLSFLFELLLDPGAVWGDVLREDLAAALATLVVGLPLWLLAWRPVLRDAAIEGEAGDRARRSLVRKVYLFLALFAGVLGVMFSSGALLYQLIRLLLGQPSPDMLLVSARLLALVLLFLLLALYHWFALRQDTRLAERSLARRHAQFPVLVLVPDEGDFARLVLDVLEREVKELPVAVHPYSQGTPDETLSAARAVLLPAELLYRPSEAMRLWLQGFDGPRLVLPTPAQGWQWVASGAGDLAAQARAAARLVRRLAEGEPLPQPSRAPSWMIVVYILAALAALEIIGLSVTFVLSLFIQM